MHKETYYDPSTIPLSKDLFLKIKQGIDVFMLTMKAKKHKLSKAQAYCELIDALESFKPDLPVTPKWLVDLYAGRKTDHNCNKEVLNALCSVLKINEENDTLFIDLIKKFKDLCAVDEGVEDFAGKYKLFIGGRYQPSMYSIAYDIPMEIFQSGIVKIIQTYTKKIYWGLLLLRDINTMEILSFDFKDNKIIGVGSFLMFKINGYKKRQIYFPGVNFGFDSATMPVVYQSFLSADPELDRSHPIVLKYFSEVVNNLRMECPTLVETERLRQMFF